MARPERNTVDYFPFYCDEGEKMFYIEQTYGNDGFATFIKILRELSKKDYHYLNLQDEPSKMFLSAKCKVSKELLISIINDLVNLGKFDAELWDNNIIWCQDFIDSIQDAYNKRNNKCISKNELLLLLTSKGILLPSKGTPKPSKCILKVPVNTQRKEKDTILEQIKEKEIKQELVLPFDSENFIKVWNVLKRQPKWKVKTNDSLQAALKKLSKFNESIAILMMENTIEGNWQGLFELKNSPINDNKRSNIDNLKDIYQDTDGSFARLQEKYKLEEENGNS